MKNLFSRSLNFLKLYAFLLAIWVLSPVLALYGFIVETSNRRKNDAAQLVPVQINEIHISEQVNLNSETLDKIITAA
jgi:hypothetical protein